MKKIILLLIGMAVFCGKTTVYAQDSADNQGLEKLNNYKYVIIPVQYSFQDKDNEYMINSRIKHRLNQLGFDTYMDVEEFPDDLKMNPCLGLKAGLNSGSEGFFSMKTELTLALKDCHDQTVFETKEGDSRAKDFETGYKEALNEAMTSLNGIDYEYNGEGDVSEEKVEKEGDSEKTEKTKDPLAALVDQTYTQDDEEYYITQIKAGYLLKNKKTDDRVAVLNLTEENDILYNSIEINGKATIKDNGDIEVEYYDKETNEMTKLVYHHEEQ